MLTGMAPLECLCHRNLIPGKTFKSSIWFRRLICDLFFSLIAWESMRIFLQPWLLCNKSLHYFFIKQEQVRNVKSARWHQNKKLQNQTYRKVKHCVLHIFLWSGKFWDTSPLVYQYLEAHYAPLSLNKAACST